jgi:hypothetical protein
MKRKFAAALAALAVIGIVPAAVIADEGGIPRWFSQFLVGFNSQVQQILTRLQAVEQQNALNTADIAHNTLDITALQAAAPAVFRQTDYAGVNVATRTFSAVGGGHCGNNEIQTLTRTPQPDGSVLITLDQNRRLGTTTCQHIASQIRSDADGQHLLRSDTLSPVDPNVVLLGTVLDVPLLIRPGSLRLGATWGNATKETQTNSAGIQNIGFSTLVGTLTAVDSVTVPAGTFTDCLRTAEVRNSPHVGNFTQYDWLCRDVGLVKRINSTTAQPIGFQLELQSFTTN